MASVLPPIPRFIFSVFEPLSLVAGAAAPVIAPDFFVRTQLAHLKPHPLLPTEQVLALQLANMYFGICLLGLVILWNKCEPQVVHAYLLSLWISDIGHLAATWYVMGSTAFFDIAHWNAGAWGNIGITTFLMASRTLYALGFFGQDQKPIKRSKRS